MTSLNAIWQAVAKRAPPPRRQLLQRLVALLRRLDNPHACLLTGRLNQNPGDQDSALQLQAWIMGEYRNDKLSKAEVAECLRLLYDLITEYNKDRSVLFPTQLMDFFAPQESPFSVSAVASGQRANRWRNALHGWIASSAEQTNPDAWVAAVVLSALIHGMLLDTAKLKQLVAKLARKERPDVTNGISSWMFDLPFQGLGNHHMQRWFPDPVTEMLIWRLMKAEFAIDERSLEKKVTQFLTAQGVKATDSPSNLTDLVTAVKSWWAERAAPIDLHCSTRSVTTHAVHERSWTRLHGLQYQPRADRTLRANEESTDLPEANYLEDLLLLNPWLALAFEALTSDDLSRVRSEVAALHAEQSHGAQAMVFVGWLLAMLHGFSAAKKGLELSTIRRRFQAAAPRLLALLGEQNPADMSTEQLEDYYSELTLDNEQQAPLRDIASGLRDFHAYLHKSCGKPLMRKEAEVLGDEHALKPVDANLISFDDYLRAQEWLDQQRGDRRERHICKIVLMLAFKVGMRRMEIFGLEMRDLQLRNLPVCVIRPNEKRHLKTVSSKRLIPLSAFLSQADRQLLADWITQRMEQLQPMDTPSRCDAYVFPQIGHAKHATWVDRITDKVCSALRAVTGDSQLFLHHLRHSFGTWTYLRLRAPDFPEVSRHFSGMPATEQAIRSVARLRVLLLGRNPDVSRSYAHVVGQLLGHSSPLVSLGHYVHSADLLIGELARRECASLPKAVLISASGLQKSAGYEHLSESMDRLVAATRQANRTENSVKSDSAEPKPPGRRPAKPPHQRSEWLSLATIQKILDMSLDGDMSDSLITKATGVSIEKVHTMRAEANRLGPLIGLGVDAQGNLVESPPPERGKAAQDFSHRLEVLLADMSIRVPELYRQGLDVYLKHFEKDKRDVVFRGKKDLNELKLILRFLKSLGAEAKEFSWMIRGLDTSSTALPDWANKLNARWKPDQIRSIRPKAAGSASSYSQWVGIFPIDANGQSLGTAMARTLFFAGVADSVIKHMAVPLPYQVDVQVKADT